MLSKFPNFRPITISQKQDIDMFTSQFDPYSDFNFTSMFCWNTDDSTQTSILNGNLVIRLPDYISGDPVYSILGKTKTKSSVSALLRITPTLRLVPEIVIQDLKTTGLSLVESIDHFDYIFALDEHANLPGKKYKSKRNKISRFNMLYGDVVKIKPIDFLRKKDISDIRKILEGWAAGKKGTEPERLAVERLLRYADSLDLIGLLMHIENQPVGFSIAEIISPGFAIYHFQKTILTYPHIDVFLTNQTSKFLYQQNCKFINWEQDLGIEGLRTTKLNYQPIKHLKKYDVHIR